MRATATATGNLPAELTTFIGRRRHLQEVKSGLAASRLLTLVGPGGVGKTRLALRAAADLQRGVRDGVWLVELAGLGDAQLVPKAVMTALGLRDQSGSWPTSLLIDAVADLRPLLVLDNCEHLLDACAVLADTLLREAPGVRILATSRQPLGITGERALPVGPLGLPDGEDGRSLQRLAQSEAVALFVERAAEASGSFELVEDNQEAVVEVCRRLDGMPLAIELAAVRLRALGVDQVLERLNDRFRLLSGGSRTAMPRHQTLEATIDWSYDLLGDSERAVLRRLSVFAGTFSLESAEEVCAGTSTQPMAFLDLLSGLVDRSFVVREGSSTTARYRLHETMREYGLMRLREAGEEADARRAHIEHYQRLARRASEDAYGPRFVDWLNRLDADADNLRAALAGCLANPGGNEAGLELAGSLWFYWMSRSISEGAHWLDPLIERSSGGGAVRARALFARGCVALHEPDLAKGLRSLQEATASSRAARDLDTLALAQGVLAIIQALSAEFREAQATTDELAALAHAAGVPSWLAWAAAAQVSAASFSGDLALARDTFGRLAALSEAHGDVWMLSYGYMNMGFGLCMARRDDPEARRFLEKALRLKREMDDRPGIMHTLEGLACCAVAGGQPLRGARLLGAVAALRRSEGTQQTPIAASLIMEAGAHAASALGAARFEDAREQGRYMDRGSAVAFALDERPQPGTRAAVQDIAPQLGKREMEVASLVADGLSNKQIASRLFVSERTVETHVSNILNKLGVNSRVQIASWASSGE